jgi:hypothetical protein
MRDERHAGGLAAGIAQAEAFDAGVRDLCRTAEKA